MIILYFVFSIRQKSPGESLQDSLDNLASQISKDLFLPPTYVIHIMA
jgi:hypothetical protein